MTKLAPEVLRERKRALRLETVTKRAVKIANEYKKSYEEAKKENEALRKELAILTKDNKSAVRHLSRKTDNEIPALLLSLDGKTRMTLRSIIRKSLHPDKHRKNRNLTSKVKDAITHFFIIVEGQIK